MPCMGCTKRVPGCHGKCEEYKQALEQQHKAKKHEADNKTNIWAESFSFGLETRKSLGRERKRR